MSFNCVWCQGFDPDFNKQRDLKYRDFALSLSTYKNTHRLKKSAHTDTHLQTPTFGKKHLNNFINPLYGRVRSHCITGLWKECSGVKKEAASMLLS